MAYAKILFENPKTGCARYAPVGVSWTTFFFGPFPALIRGDWKWGIIIVLTMAISWGFAVFVYMFIYNKLYIKDLIADGYKAKSVDIGTLEQVEAKSSIILPRWSAPQEMVAERP